MQLTAPISLIQRQKRQTISADSGLLVPLKETSESERCRKSWHRLLTQNYTTSYKTFAEAWRAYNNVQTANGERPAHCLFSNITVDCDMFFRPSRADLFTFGSPLGSSFLGRRLRSNYNLVRISTFLFDALAEAMSAKPTNRGVSSHTGSKCERLRSKGAVCSFSDRASPVSESRLTGNCNRFNVALSKSNFSVASMSSYASA